MAGKKGTTATKSTTAPSLYTPQQRAAFAKEDAAKARSEAPERIERALSRLAALRDALQRVENGTPISPDGIEDAFFARCALVEACTEIEEALFGAGVLRKDPDVGGFFS